MANHLADQRGLAEGVADDEASPLILQARLLVNRLEISNLKEHIRRLEAFIDKSGNRLPTPEKLTQSGTDSMADYESFVDAALVLIAVLDRYRGTISVDFSKKELIDRAARPSKRVIAGPKRTVAFFDWLDQNKHLLLGISKE